MAEQTVTTSTLPTEVKIETPVVEAPKVELPKEDLVSRVSKFKQEAPKKEETNPFGLSKEDYDKVQSDPTLSKFYKSMQSDYVKKTQEAAEIKRKADEQLKQSSTWTTERLQQEMNRPDFVQAANQILSKQNPSNSGLTDQEYSALTDKEKAQLQQANQRISNLEMQNWQMLQRQQDEQLKQRYANYDSDIIDTTIKKLAVGEIQADRSYIYKALYHDDNVKNAYEMGKKDALEGLKEKQQALSFDGGFATSPTNDVPKQEQGESNTAYFKRLATKRLAELTKGANR